MIHFVEGILHFASPIFVVINVNGIGYKIFIPAHIYEQLPPLLTKIHLHTSFVIREMSQTLYGFLSESERDLFEVLITVSGVGPKTGVSMIGHLQLKEFLHAIKTSDVMSLCKVPGIGKKTAERLLIELKDKINSISCLEIQSYMVDTIDKKESAIVKDALNALIHLGYSQQVAQKAIKSSLKENDPADLATLIRLALKNV